MQLNGHLLFPAALLLAAFSVMICNAQPISMSGQQPSYYNEIEADPDPETVLELLARLEQSFIRARENSMSKRGMDLGLSRGYSGSMAGKHLMGLASANFAGGPGRRRRSISTV